MFKKFPGNISKRIKTLWCGADLKGRKYPDLEILAALGCMSFSFHTLASATNYYSLENIFYVGFFDVMYKGMLEDGTQIAVWKQWDGEIEEFLMKEIEWLSRLHHCNVAKMYGYYAHDEEILIVFKYYPNNLRGLLETSEGRGQLDWARRYKIMQGIASGLNYLHSGSQNGIVLHRYIMPSNIWLDHEWNPLIAGFHLGAQLLEDQTTFTNRIVGTCYSEYVAPEHMARGYAAVKIDVYSFGVTMLELISGKGTVFYELQAQAVAQLTDWATELYKKGKISEIVDPVLAYSAIREEVENCIKISLLCIQWNPNSRPQMADVVSMLEGKWGHTETPICAQDDEFEEAVRVGEEFSYNVPMEEHGNTFTVDAQDDHRRGGFGLVYKGKLENGREIAVKKALSMSEELRKALMKEIDLLSRVKHPNVVKLVGYCTDNNELSLVSEYVPNKSLDKLLVGPNRREDLNWRRTYNIIVGIAKGLSYLHDDPQNCIIHRDIKASNILIDHKWVPKIADFGISRLFDEDQTHVYTSAVGTWGYIAPEYLDNGHVSVKTDVYSFGVLVLELISGTRFSFIQQEDKAISLLDWAYKLFKTGRVLKIMDRALADSAVVEQVKNCIIIGLLCVQGDPKSRPDMECVISMLTGRQGRREMLIRRPGIYGYRGYHSGSPFVL